MTFLDHYPVYYYYGTTMVLLLWYYYGTTMVLLLCPGTMWAHSWTINRVTGRELNAPDYRYFSVDYQFI